MSRARCWVAKGVAVVGCLYMGSGGAVAEGPTPGPVVRPTRSLEETVLYTYAKLGFYLERSIAARPWMPTRRIQGPAVVTVSNLQSGPIRDVDNVLFGDLVTPRSKRVLTMGTWTEGGQNGVSPRAGLVADWTTAAERPVEAALRQPLASVIAQTGYPAFGVDRYVSYQVSLRWQRLETVYRALALFSPDNEKSEPRVAFLDSVAGWGGALDTVYLQIWPPELGADGSNAFPAPAAGTGDLICRRGVCCGAGTSRCLWPAAVGANGQ